MGIVIDEKLSWKPRTEKKTEIRKYIRIFYVKQNWIRVDVLKTLYLALIHSWLIYGRPIENWTVADNVVIEE